MSAFSLHLSLSPAGIANATLLASCCTALLVVASRRGALKVTLPGKVLVYLGLAFGYFAVYEILIDYFPGMAIGFAGFFGCLLLTGLVRRPSPPQSHPTAQDRPR